MQSKTILKVEKYTENIDNLPRSSQKVASSLFQEIDCFNKNLKTKLLKLREKFVKENANNQQHLSKIQYNEDNFDQLIERYDQYFQQSKIQAESFQNELFYLSQNLEILIDENSELRQFIGKMSHNFSVLQQNQGFLKRRAFFRNRKKT